MSHEGIRFLAIRGFMKSGTNWVCNLLGRHPAVLVRGEFHWQELLQPLLDRERSSAFRTAGHFRHSLAAFRDFVRQSMVFERGEAVVLGDRTPHTIAPLILPEAWHVSIIRDGRDVLVSRVFHLFNNPGVTRLFQRHADLQESLEEFRADPWFFHQHPERLLANEELVRVSARWWREHLETDRRTVESEPGLKVLFVRYEDLHADTAGECQRMFRFLDLDPDLAPPLDETVSAGFGEERPSEFYRKGAVGDWQNYFTDSARQWFVEAAGEELVRQGYASGDRW